jgi:hypothetical protein
VIKEARALEAAGCFSLVLECVPAVVAAAVTREVGIPTIGIGAGGGTSGQVLVYHDLLGMMQHPHHAKVTPKFCKQYSAVGAVIQQARGGALPRLLLRAAGWVPGGRAAGPHAVAGPACVCTPRPRPTGAPRRPLRRPSLLTMPM